MENTITRHRIILIASIGIVVLLVTIGGYTIFRNEKQDEESSRKSSLRVMTQLKVTQLEQWQKERLSEAVFFSANQPLVDGVQCLLYDDRSAEEYLRQSLSHIRTNNRYENIFILDTRGRIVFTLDSSLLLADGATSTLSEQVVAQRQILFTDLYSCSLHNKIHFDIIAPIVGKQDQPIATLVFRVNPNDYIFPLIQSWPAASESAESFLVRRDGDSIVYLNKLRHIDNIPLHHKISIAGNDNVPAVVSTQGKEGFFEGLDYRGVRVLSYTAPVPNLPWYIVSKVDKAEVFRDLYQNFGLMVVIALLVLAVAVTSLAWISHYRRGVFYKKLLESEMVLFKSQQEYKTTLYSIGDGVIITNDKGIIQAVNPAAEELLGISEQGAAGRRAEEVFTLVDEVSRSPIENPVSAILSNSTIQTLSGNTLLVNVKGTEIPIADSAAPIYNKEGQLIGVVLIFIDRTAERLQQKALRESEERFQRLFENAPLAYQSLNINGEIVEVNRAWLETFGYSKEEVIGKPFTMVLPPAEVDAYRVRFPKFIEQGKVYTELRMQHKDGTELLVAVNGRIGHKSDGTFDKTHCIVQDITLPRRMEEKLKESEERYRLMMENSLDAILITSPDGRIHSANRAACKMFGLTEEQICQAGRDGIVDHSDPRLPELLKRREQVGYIRDEITYIRGDGTKFPAEITSALFRTSKGELRTSMIIRDITTR